MLSGNDGLFDKVRGKMAGSSNYITKPFEPNHLVKEIEKFVKTERPPAPAAAPKQPATATQAPATAGRVPGVQPVDPEAAKQISKKLSGIYIPTAVHSAGIGVSPTMPEGTVVPGGVEKQKASGGAKPQTPGAKRPTPKLNDEPEIKIFYHNESTATPPPEQAGALSPMNKTSDGSGQERATPSAPAAQHTVGAGSGIRPAAATPPQASKSISPPTTGLQPQPGRNEPSSAEGHQTAPAAAQPSAAPRPAAPPPARAAAQTQTGSIKAVCPGCGTIYTNIKPEHIGKYARCKKCETRFLIS
jgi:hypothetical protein